MACAGLEVDQTRMNQPLPISDREGLEALPVENLYGPAVSALQVIPDTNKEATFLNNTEPADLEFNKPSKSQNSILLSKFRSHRKTCLLVALFVLAIVVVAITVPLTTTHRGSTR